jgi:outer membrane protein assembly factor BamB
MPKVSLLRLVLCVVFLGSCAGFRADAATDGSPLVSPELLKHAGLKSVWENVLPIKKGEKLKEMYFLRDRIYALSDRNFMVCLDRNKGKTVFARSMAAPGLPVDSPKLFVDKLMSIGGKNLIELDPETGAEKKVTNVGFSIACPPARNSDFFYLASPDRRLHALRIEDKVQIFEVAAENESKITSIVADEESVVFATDAGNVISIAAGKPRRLWQFDAAESISGQLHKDADSLFFASRDTNVYRVDIVALTQVSLAWKYQTDGRLTEAPGVTQMVVYQVVHDKGLTAIDRDSGRFMWRVPGGVGLLAEAADKAYVFTKTRTLVVMDNITRKKLYEVNFAGASRYTANTEDSLIYVGDEKGRLCCLRPVGLTE